MPPSPTSANTLSRQVSLRKKTPAAENKEPSQEFDWRPEANAELLQFAVAILKALAGTTRAGIVTADMRTYLYLFNLKTIVY